jgi:(4-O-methyl)-D-glucuronate---lignin esterase
VPGSPARGVPTGAAAAAAAGARPGGAAGAARGPLPAGLAQQGPSAQEQIANRGWAYATINTASIQADCGAGLTVGIIGLVNKGQPRKLDDWGVLSAWGWGMSKLLDYFETDKAVDAKKVATQGHSRNGKAALVAMAYDERFLTSFVSSSGEGGAKLHRRKYGELIENLAALNEYHWMAGNFLKYAGRWDTLPVDSHELVALCAPRPVFLSAGKGPDENPDGSTKRLKPGDPGVILSRGPVELQAANINDAWVDAKGTFLAGVGAGPVYRLLGKKDLGTTEFPKIETALLTGDIGFRQHSSGHTPGPNWPVFLEFAAKYFDAPEAAPPAVSKKK